MLQLHRYFKESHSQYLPLDAPSWIFPSSFTAGACWGQWDVGAVQGVLWCWDSPERSSRELLSSEARGWHQEPAGYWEQISVGASGAPGREMLLGRNGGRSCSQQQWGVNVQRAWGRGCLSSQGVPPCSKESQMCWKRAQTQQSETPAQARGGDHPPQPALGVVTRSLSILLNILKNKFWN